MILHHDKAFIHIYEVVSPLEYHDLHIIFSSLSYDVLVDDHIAYGNNHYASLDSWFGNMCVNDKVKKTVLDEVANCLGDPPADIAVERPADGAMPVFNREMLSIVDTYFNTWLANAALPHLTAVAALWNERYSKWLNTASSPGQSVALDNIKNLMQVTIDFPVEIFASMALNKQEMCDYAAHLKTFQDAAVLCDPRDLETFFGNILREGDKRTTSFSVSQSSTKEKYYAHQRKCTLLSRHYEDVNLS